VSVRISSLCSVKKTYYLGVFTGPTERGYWKKSVYFGLSHVPLGTSILPSAEDEAVAVAEVEAFVERVTVDVALGYLVAAYETSVKAADRHANFQRPYRTIADRGLRQPMCKCAKEATKGSCKVHELISSLPNSLEDLVLHHASSYKHSLLETSSGGFMSLCIKPDRCRCRETLHGPYRNWRDTVSSAMLPICHFGDIYRRSATLTILSGPRPRS
jgi:hypothetical protein